MAQKWILKRSLKTYINYEAFEQRPKNTDYGYTEQRCIGSLVKLNMPHPVER
jgi:hypothetical protein